ncbi:MAG: DNA polymerase III subunit gamma/tau [Patescibacteria group bacterium]
MPSSYRTLRPKNFDEVISQDFITTSLKNQLKSQKTAHAYLFSGPRGVGKTSVARILAKALNCKNLQNGNPCRECENCKLIESGRTLDIIEIDGASQRKIEEARELIETVNFPPSVLEKKVYIIDEVHQLTKESISALLKTLEEPPEYATFILATTETQKMLPTIVSRCQHFLFRPIPRTKIIEVLQNAVSLTGVEADAEALEIIAAKSEGCARDALSIFDQIAGFSENKKISIESAREILGIVPTEEIFEILKLILSSNKKAFDKFYELYFLGISSEILMDNFISVTRNLAVFIASDGKTNFDLTANEKTLFLNFLSKNQINTKVLIEILETFIQSKRYFSVVDNPMIPFEIAIFKSINEIQNSKNEKQNNIRTKNFTINTLNTLQKNETQNQIAIESEVFYSENQTSNFSESKRQKNFQDLKNSLQKNIDKLQNSTDEIQEKNLEIESQNNIETAFQSNTVLQEKKVSEEDFKNQISNSNSSNNDKIRFFIEKISKEKFMLGSYLKTSRIYETEKNIVIEPNPSNESMMRISSNVESLEKNSKAIFGKNVLIIGEKSLEGNELKGVIAEIFKLNLKE